MRWRSCLLARSTAAMSADESAAVSRIDASTLPSAVFNNSTLTVKAPATFATLPLTIAFAPSRSATSRANGSLNVVPARCRFSLDIRATTDPVRDACARDVLAQAQTICERRGVQFHCELTMRAAAAPSAPDWQARWERAVAALGLPLHRMPSGAGHDAMKLHEMMPQAMLFQRGLNAGISHNPLEAITNDDTELAVCAFQQLLDELAQQGPR